MSTTGNGQFSPEIEQRGISAIRGLAMDAPLAARSGHQGTAMSLAPLAHVLFTRVLKYDASDPSWPNRDRFILSAGHASILQYSLLFLTGQGLELDDLRDFRQLGSLTPGHPEAGHTPGVEVTTGPLGQGLANSVGMAIAERYLASQFGQNLVDHHTFVIAGDGDLSEGVSHEAASLAGHLGLGKIVVVYDDNHISIDGSTDLSLSDDAAKRFESYGWDVNSIGDTGDDLDKIEEALLHAKAVVDKPSLIIMNTKVGFPSPDLTGDPKAHGNPFGEAETAATKEVMGIPSDESFWIPEDVLEMYRSAGSRQAADRTDWEDELLNSSQKDQWDAMHSSSIGSSWSEGVTFETGKQIATRKASQQCVTALAAASKKLIGGSADLTGNTGLVISDSAQTSDNHGGSQIYFGVREHAMGSTLVGAAKHGGVLPISGTFMVFSDYMRPAIRLAAMSKAKCVFVFTHDSVGVGEDGPTHQPIEQIMSLRTIPGLQVIRPADATETVGAWEQADTFDGPSTLVFSRQDVPVLEGSSSDLVAKGAYEIGSESKPDLILLGTGSEVSVCIEAASKLEADGTKVRVVSMPCWSLFEAQPEEYQRALLPSDIPTVSVEAGVTLGWSNYAQENIGIDRFGISAPGDTVMDTLGISSDNVIAKAQQLLK